MRNLQPLNDVFDYRQHHSLFIPVGIELMRLRQIIETHGNCFDEFLDDLITVLRIQSDASWEYFSFKNEVMYFGYLRNTPNNDTARKLDTLMDFCYNSIKQRLINEQFYVGGRFDYCVNKHSNYGLLLTAT